MAVPLRHSSVKFQNYTCLSKWNCKKTVKFYVYCNSYHNRIARWVKENYRNLCCGWTTLACSENSSLTDYRFLYVYDQADYQVRFQSY